MRKFIFLLLFSGYFIQSGLSQFTRFNFNDFLNIETRIAGEMSNEQMVGLSVGIIRNGEIAHLKGYGVIDQSTNENATEHSMYRLASVSKTVTAVLALQLMEANDLDFNEDIRTYVPEYPVKPEGVITTEELLSNESGIIHYSGTANGQYCSEPYDVTARNNYIASHTNHYDPVAAIDIFKNQQICFQPGEHYQYTTWGFCLMAAVIERATSKSYQELLFDNIVCPLNLPSLQIEFQDRRPYPNEVTGYRISGGTVLPPAPSIDLTDISYKVGGGGLIGSVTDLTLFIQGIVNADLFTAATRDFMGTIHVPNDGVSKNYGYGTSSGFRDGLRLYWHSGSQSKTATLIYYSPDNKNGVALMCNTQGVNLFTLARSIYDFLPSTTLNMSPVYTAPVAEWNYDSVVKEGLYESSGIIQATGNIPNGHVTFEAKNLIELNPLFQIDLGAEFKGFINSGCE